MGGGGGGLGGGKGEKFCGGLALPPGAINWPLIPESGKVFNVIENHHKLFLSSSLGYLLRKINILHKRIMSIIIL